MRLLIVSEDPEIVGGIPSYTVAVAERLASRGHRVDYLYGGGWLRRYDWRLRRRWRCAASAGVRFHGLINADSIGVNLGDPLADVWSPDAEVFARKAESLRPDVIHIHSLLGIPSDSLRRFAELAPVVMTFHEFTSVCQRRVLVRRDGSLCTTYPSQRDCPNCVDFVRRRRYRLRARLERTARGAPLRVVHRAEALFRRDIKMARPTDGLSAGAGGDDRVRPFAARLQHNVRLINDCVSAPLAVSESVRETLANVGVSPARVHVIHIGSNSAERIPRMPLPSIETGSEVTFLFLGAFEPHKGAHLLVEAAAAMDNPPPVILAGRGSADYIEYLKGIAPRTVEFVGPYIQPELPGLLRRADVLVAPAVGPDTSPQVVLEALAAGRPVIGSRIGGLLDFVDDGVNGRLFTPGDTRELRAILHDLREPRRVAALAAGVRAPLSVDTHVTALEEIYYSVPPRGLFGEERDGSKE